MGRKALLLVASLALVASFSVDIAAAGPISAACMRSDRATATRSLCRCIEQVADQTLRPSDQRRAAKFFRDPQRAHEVWASKTKSDDAFWDRYLRFGAAAEASCSG